MKNRRRPSPSPLRLLTGLPRLFVTVLVFCLVTAVAATTLFPNRTGKVAASSSAQNGDVRQNKTSPNKTSQDAAQRAAQQDDAPKVLSDEVLDQIAALQQEKRQRTPEQDKIDSQLLQAVKMSRGEPIADGVPTLLTDVQVDDAGRTGVDITAEVSDALLENLRALGVEIESAFPRFRSIRAEVPLDKLEAIAAFPEVIFIMPKQIPTTNRAGAPQGRSVGEQTVDDEAVLSPAAPPRQKKTDFATRAARVRATLLKALPAVTEKRENIPQPAIGSVTSEGDRAHRADEARGTFNVTGAGVRIGVLSDGVMGLANAQASGDLPEVTILPGQAGPSPNSGEGTAMLEIIHDLAPGAQLFFATAFNGQASFAQNIIDLRLAGCDIIVDDVSYSFESPFQDGQDPNISSQTNGAIIAQAVIDVTNDGALYFSSAGNAGNKNDGTSGVWEGDFTPSGNFTFIQPTPTPSPNPSPTPSPATRTVGPVHDFNPDPAVVAQFNTITAPPSPAAQVILFWSDPLGGSGNDYDLYVLNSANRLVAASVRVQNGDDDPIEFAAAAANVTGNRIVIARFDPNPAGGVVSADRFLHLTTSRGRLALNTPGQTRGHSTARLAYSTAASNATVPFPNPFNPSNMVETFSSDGPRRLFFNSDGSPKTPGNFSSTGGELRQKPDLTAADGVSVTGSGGAFSTTFFGTSAAAPHAAAIAGLVKDAKPSLTQAEARTILSNASIDIEMPGVDRDSGTGIVDAYRAVQATGVQGFANLELGTVTASEVGGNGNASIEPGERGTLNVQLRNIGLANATNITATLTSTTPGVVITPPATRTFPDIAPNGTANATFEFVVTSSAACGSTLSFTLTLNYTGNPTPETFTFTVPTTNGFPLISGIVDNTPAESGPGYTATSGIQMGRITRTGNISVCGTQKPNPGVFSPTTAFRYDAYTFQNASSTSACVTITLTTPLTGNAQGGGDIQFVAYAGSFNPANPAENFLGDHAGFIGSPRTFSVNLPANTNLVVVVNQANAASTNTLAYTLQISGSNPPCATGAGGVPANQPPVNIVPGDQMTRPNNPLVFSTANGNPITVSDPDAGNNPVQVTLTVTNGTLSTTNTTGAVFSGNGTATITATDTIANINAALEGLTFTPTSGFTGAATLTITTSDQGFTGSGGVQTDTDTITINVMNPSFTVNSVEDMPDAAPGDDICADSMGVCTLRAAIEEANARLDVNVIAFNVNGVIELDSPLPSLTRAMMLMGEGVNETIVRRAPGATSNFRIFNVTRTASVTISGMTISGGRSNEGGGGIHNTGRLTIGNSTISDNTAITEGGGIRNTEGGTVTLFASTVSGNTAVGTVVSGAITNGFGGGIVNDSGTIEIATSTISGNTANGRSTGGGIDNGSTMSMINSTVSGNSANGATAGGIGDNGGGIWNISSITLRNITVTNNTAAGTSSASGVLAFGGSVNVGNTIIAANVNNTVTADVLRGRGNGTFASQGYNLIGSSPTGIGFDPAQAVQTNAEGGATINAVGDLTGTLAAPLDPRLAPLADNSSPTQIKTQTHALLPGSPAIDAGNNALAPTIDQRSSPRPIDGNGDGTAMVDIGAFELNVGPTADNVAISGVVRSTRGAPLSGVTVTISGNAQQTRVTDRQGRYAFTVEPGGLYTVSVSRAGYTFNPPTRSFGGSVTANQTADFTAVAKGRTFRTSRLK